MQKNEVFVREHGPERPMPERLDVTTPQPLRAEMDRDGRWARAQLQVRDQSVMLPCDAGIDHIRAVRVADVAPVGPYRETRHEDTVGPPIWEAIILRTDE